MTGELDLLSNFSAWRMAGSGGFRRCADGTVESYGGPGLFWYAGQVFQDFVLRVNGGSLGRRTIPESSFAHQRLPTVCSRQSTAVRNPDRRPGTNVIGSELHLTGAIYQLAPAARSVSRPVGQWNDFEIAARGAVISVRLNGEEVSRLEDALREPRGYIGLQNHHEGSAVRFRNLRVEAGQELGIFGS